MMLPCSRRHLPILTSVASSSLAASPLANTPPLSMATIETLRIRAIHRIHGADLLPRQCPITQLVDGKQASCGGV